MVRSIIPLVRARLVTLQFSFTNPQVVPSTLKVIKPETPRTSDARRQESGKNGGALMIVPTERCSLASFLSELEAAGYEMVDALCQRRWQPPVSGQKRKTCFMVRFTFAQKEFAEISDEFRVVRDNIRADCMMMCRNALWRVRAFSNPCFKHGEELRGQRAISINMEVRVPRYNPSGELVVEWCENKAVPLRAKHQLCVVKETVVLTPTT